MLYLDTLALTGPHIPYAEAGSPLTSTKYYPNNIMDLLFRGSAEHGRRSTGTAGLADLCVEGHITWFILSIHRPGGILRATSSKDDRHKAARQRGNIMSKTG